MRQVELYCNEFMQILTTRIDVIRRHELRSRLLGMLDKPRAHVIVTANPEIVLHAHHDQKYRDVVNAADLVVPDGFGLVLAGLLQGRGVRRITGSDMLEALMSLARERRLRVLCALRAGGLTTAHDLQQAYPDLTLLFLPPSESGEKVRGMPADIVIANYGAPEQEFWIAQHHEQFPNSRIFIGLGGALDYATGRIRRAPMIVRGVGFEWLYRLIRQPHRARRIWRAVVEFPLAVVWYSLWSRGVMRRRVP